MSNKPNELYKLIDEAEMLASQGKEAEAAVLTGQIRRRMAHLLVHIGKRVNGDMDKRLDKLETKIEEIGSPEHLENNLRHIGKNLLWNLKWKILAIVVLPLGTVIHIDKILPLILMLF